MTESFITEAFLGLIAPGMYIVIAAVFGVCFALKKASFFDDRFIPLAAIVLGVLFRVLVGLSGNAAIGDMTLQGIVAGMAAVYCANVIKQIGGK